MELKTYYVTFGMGSIFRGFHVAVEAFSEDIVRAYANKQNWPWSTCCDTEPQYTTRLRQEPERLFYSAAEHV